MDKIIALDTAKEQIVNTDGLSKPLISWFEKGKQLLKQRREAEININTIDWNLIAWLEETDQHGEEAYSLLEALGIDYTKYRRLMRFSRIPAPLRRPNISMSHYEVIIPLVTKDNTDQIEFMLNKIEELNLTRDTLRYYLKMLNQGKEESINIDAIIEKIKARIFKLVQEFPDKADYIYSAFRSI